MYQLNSKTSYQLSPLSHNISFVSANLGLGGEGRGEGAMIRMFSTPHLASPHSCGEEMGKGCHWLSELIPVELTLKDQVKYKLLLNVVINHHA